MIPELPSFGLDTRADDPKRLHLHATLMDSFSHRSHIPNPLLTDHWLPWAAQVKYAGDHDCHTVNHLWRRHQAVSEYSWAVPCDAALQAIVKACHGRGLLELGSGTGYWAKLLSAYGLDVIAVDNGEEGGKDALFSPHFPAAKRMDALKYLQDNGGSADKVLFLCWPRNADDWLEAYRGDTVIWVGERDGCTWEMPEDSGWKAVETVRLPTWGLIHDRLVIWHRDQPEEQQPSTADSSPEVEAEEEVLGCGPEAEKTGPKAEKAAAAMIRWLELFLVTGGKDGKPYKALRRLVLKQQPLPGDDMDIFALLGHPQLESADTLRLLDMAHGRRSGSAERGFSADSLNEKDRELLGRVSHTLSSVPGASLDTALNVLSAFDARNPMKERLTWISEACLLLSRSGKKAHSCLAAELVLRGDDFVLKDFHSMPCE